MGLTAVIFTFHQAALLGAFLLAVGTFAICFLFVRQKKHALRVCLLVAVAWFFIALFGFRTFLGIGVGTVEIVSYEPTRVQ